MRVRWLRSFAIVCGSMWVEVAAAGASPVAPCPGPRPSSDATIGPDGAALVLVRDAAVVCLHRVDEDGEAARVARWDAASPRAPVVLAALADGSVAIVRGAPREDGTYPLVLRSADGDERTLPVRFPAAPARLVAHPSLPRVEALVSAGGRTRAWVVDTSDAVVLDVRDAR
jgi:hypothetical protein